MPQLLLALRLSWLLPFMQRYLPLFLKIREVLFALTVIILVVQCAFASVGGRSPAPLVHLRLSSQQPSFRQVGGEAFGERAILDPDLQPHNELYHEREHTSWFGSHVA